MKRKIFSLILCSALLLSGCGSKSQPVKENNRDTEVTESTVSEDIKDTEVNDSEESIESDSNKEVSDNTSNNLDDIMKDIEDNSNSIRDTLDDINNPSSEGDSEQSNEAPSTESNSNSLSSTEETFITKFDGMNAMREYDGALELFTDEADDYVEMYEDLGSPDNFLGYDCYYESSPEIEDILDDELQGYSIMIAFKDKESYKNGQSDIDSYLSSLSSSSEDLSKYKSELSKSYICKDSKGDKYVVVPYKMAFELNDSAKKDFLSLYHNEFISLLVMPYDYYNNVFLSSIK